MYRKISRNTVQIGQVTPILQFMNIFLGYNGYKILTFINTLDKTTIKINWKLRLPLMNHSITTFSHLHRKKKDKIFKKANNYVVNKNLF